MGRFWKESELRVVRKAYRNPLGFDLEIIANSLGRSHAAVACKAHDLGITYRRGHPPFSAAHIHSIEEAQKKLSKRPEIIAARVVRLKAYFKRCGHPRGMFGKRHSLATKVMMVMSH